MSDTREESVSVHFQRGLRPDGELEYIQVKQYGYGELRLTLAQAKSLAEVLRIKLIGVSDV
jgi:hypothetical protein